jgi:hypothetical protein
MAQAAGAGPVRSWPVTAGVVAAPGSPLTSERPGSWAAYRGHMLIALLAVLGVDLWVVVVLLAVVLTRRRWVSRQPGAFKGAIRVTEGEVPGLGTRWRRGYGRWVRDILVWTRAPFLFRNELVLAEALAGEARAAEPGEVRRLGKDPAVVRLVVDGGARVEVAASAGGRAQVPGPFAERTPETR